MKCRKENSFSTHSTAENIHLEMCAAMEYNIFSATNGNSPFLPSLDPFLKNFLFEFNSLRADNTQGKGTVCAIPLSITYCMSQHFISITVSMARST